MMEEIEKIVRDEIGSISRLQGEDFSGWANAAVIRIQKLMEREPQLLFVLTGEDRGSKDVEPHGIFTNSTECHAAEELIRPLYDVTRIWSMTPVTFETWVDEELPTGLGDSLKELYHDPASMPNARSNDLWRRAMEEKLGGSWLDDSDA